MKYTYEINIDDMGNETLKRIDAEGFVTWIPMNQENGEYQVYLESLEPKAKAPKVVDEAATDTPA